jgi:hypothetical protein
LRQKVKELNDVFPYATIVAKKKASKGCHDDGIFSSKGGGLREAAEEEYQFNVSYENCSDKSEIDLQGNFFQDNLESNRLRPVVVLSGEKS